MANESPRRGGVIWAVDPFELVANPTPESVADFARWVAGRGSRVLPVYVFNARRAVEYGYTGCGETLRRAVDARVHGLRIQGAEPATLLEAGAEDPVGALLAFAAREEASAIAVCSHGRGGMKRFFLGSFTELLLEKSFLPIYFMRRTPLGVAATSASGLLFPTNFSAASEATFRALLKEEGTLRERLTVLHVVSGPSPYVGELCVQIPSAFFDDQLAFAEAEGPRWVQIAEGAGVRAELVVRQARSGATLAAVIREEARSRPPRLVVFTSACGSLNGYFYGGSSAELFRCGDFAALVYGPSACAAARSRTEQAAGELGPDAAA